MQFSSSMFKMNEGQKLRIIMGPSHYKKFTIGFIKLGSQAHDTHLLLVNEDYIKDRMLICYALYKREFIPYF